MIIDEETYLEHYGVKGMKWGVRKSQESGSASGTSLRSRLATRQTEVKERKASTVTARALKTHVRIRELQKEIDAIPQSSWQKRSKQSQVKTLTQLRDEDLKYAEKVRNSRLTPTQKKVLIGATVVGVLAAGAFLSGTGRDRVAGGVRRTLSQAKYGTTFKINKDFARKDLSPDEILKNVAKGINPGYSKPGGKMNCRRSTFAYELRRRGFDVEATTSTLGVGQSETGFINALITGDKNIYNNASLSSMLNKGGSSTVRPTSKDTRAFLGERETVETISKLRDALSKHPEGARGEVVFEEEGFGHSMAWEVIKGVPHIFDTQKGQHFPTTEGGLGKLAEKWGTPKAMQVTRLDNVDLDLKFLSQWARNAGGK